MIPRPPSCSSRPRGEGALAGGGVREHGLDRFPGRRAKTPAVACAVLAPRRAREMLAVRTPSRIPRKAGQAGGGVGRERGGGGRLVAGGPIWPYIGPPTDAYDLSRHDGALRRDNSATAERKWSWGEKTKGVCRPKARRWPWARDRRTEAPGQTVTRPCPKGAGQGRLLLSFLTGKDCQSARRANQEACSTFHVGPRARR